MVKTPSASARMSANFKIKSKKWGYRYPFVLLFSLLSIGYLLLTFIPKPQQTILQHYHLSHAGYYGIVIPVAVYLVCVWVAGLYGSLVFKTYANSIKQSSDGRPLNTLSIGLLALTIAQPLAFVISASFGLFERYHLNLVPKFTIVNNYAAIFLAAVPFAIIAVGSAQLSRLIAKKAKPLVRAVGATVFIIFNSFYIYLIVIQPVHTPLARHIYYLPDWLLVTSIAIPYLIIWYFGLNAAYQIYRFQINIRGLIYKSALRYLASGIALVIISSISTRAIATVSANLSKLSLTPLLFIVYALLLLDGAGFILIAIGAKKLRKIEEV
jgi:MFS family permease